MTGPEEERPQNPEDLFEDLDRFFAPIEDDDWLSDAPADTAAGPPPPPPDPVAESTDEPFDDWSPDIAIPDPGDMAPDIVLDADDAVGPAERPETAVPPVDEPDPQPASRAPAAGAPFDEDTAWLMDPGADVPEAAWDRLRGTEDDDLAVAEAESPGTAASSPAAGDTRPPEPLEVTPEVDAAMPGDAGAPPAAMPHLPADDVERAPVVDELPPPSPDLFGPPADVDEPAATTRDLTVDSLGGPPSQYSELPTAEEDDVEPVAPAASQEPGAGDVEAAAEHFAAGLRSPEDVERELLSDLEQPSGPRTVSIEPALPGEDRRDAPTWEEPAAAPVEPEPTPSTSTPGPGRNLPAAVVSGALLAAAVIALLAVGKVPFAFFAGAAILLAQAELYAVIRARGGQPAAALGLVAGALVLVAAYNRGEQGALFVIVLAMALAVPWYMAAPEKGRRGTVNNAATTLLGFLYVPFLGSFAFQLLRADGVVGRDLLLTVLGLAVLYDICAYAIGSVWGNRALAPSISPQKSWEGAIGATFVLLVAGLSILPSIGPFQGRAGVAIGLALVIAVAAPLGDLVESALKRDLGVKDMGSILPGHGGVLDRIDSILLSAPAAWYFLRIVLT